MGPPPLWCGEQEDLTVTSAGYLTRLVRAGDDAGRVQPLIDRLRESGVTIVSVTPRRESLEDLFVRTVGDGPEAGTRAATATAPAPPATSSPATTGGAA